MVVYIWTRKLYCFQVVKLVQQFNVEIKSLNFLYLKYQNSHK